MSNKLLKQVLELLKIEKGPLSNGDYIVWCPLHPDGQGEPPHQPNLHVGPKGFYCHACGEKGSLYELAKHLKIEIKNVANGNPNNFEATYDYLDEKSQLLFQAVRKPGKKFFQRRPDGKGGWVYDLKGVRRVLYNLPQLISKLDGTVFVTEGEKDVKALTDLGLLATTSPGGAGKWRDEYNQFLKNRQVIILPDNDKPGLAHAEQIAKLLNGTAQSIKLVKLPGLPDKGDISDWIASKHSIEELLKVVDNTEIWKTINSADQSCNSGTADNSDTAEEGGRAADIAVRLVLESKAELFHDERDDPYAVVHLPEGCRILALKSNKFKQWVSHLIWSNEGKAYGTDVLTAAIRALSGMACFDKPLKELSVRSAWAEDNIWLDINGMQAICVTPDGWDVVKKPPILFRSFQSQRPLVEPVRGGDIAELLSFVNIQDDHAKLLFMCYLVAALVPDIPIAALVVHGMHGTAKTTLLKVVKNLIDPSAVEVRAAVHDPGEFALAAWQNRVLFFDNLSSVPVWLSDALCRAVTGEGWAKRTLYTDEDTTFFEYKRVVGLAGINLVANRPDLLDRSIILSLAPVSPENRRSEQLFWKQFNEARPRILGGMLDILSGAMKILPNIDLPSLPRLADFTRWAAAVAEVMGYGATTFLDAYVVNVGNQNQAALEASPVAQAVIHFMANSLYWKDTASELLEQLTSLAEKELKINTRTKYWPKAPYILTRRVREVQQNLLAAGIGVEIGRTAQERWVKLEKLEEEGVTSVTTVMENTPDDDNDDNDDSSVTSEGESELPF